MKVITKITKYFSFLFLFFILTCISCASAKQNPYYKKRTRVSHVNTSQLGRNRYFFSVNYQKKLQKSMKKKR